MSVSFRRASFGAAAAVVMAATVAGVLVSGSAGSVAATSAEPAARTVTVSGSGQASGTPDVLRLELGVQRTGKDVNAALSAAGDDIRRIKEALARHGVKDADIQTSQLSINQHYGPMQGYEDKAPAPGPVPEPAVIPDGPPAPDAPDAPAAAASEIVAPASWPSRPPRTRPSSTPVSRAAASGTWCRSAKATPAAGSRTRSRRSTPAAAKRCRCTPAASRST